MSAPLWFLLFALGQVAFVLGAGVVSLVVHRRGIAAARVQRAVQRRGSAAFVGDLWLAASLTWCGCLTQTAVRQLPDARAVRFLWWSSALRSTTLLALALTGPMMLPALVVVVAWGALAPRALGPSAVSPASVFLSRTPRGRAGTWDALKDAAGETRDMWRAYGWVLLPLAALASAWCGAQSTMQSSFPLTLAAAGVATLIRVDLIAVLPLIFAAWRWGVPPETVAAVALVVEVNSVRTRRLFCSYLRAASQPRYLAFTRAFALVIAVVLGASAS